MQFSVGDKVILKDEQGFGTITKIKDGTIWVFLDDGIDVPLMPTQLVKIAATFNQKPEKTIEYDRKPINKSIETNVNKENTTDEFNWDEKKPTIPKSRDPQFRVNVSDIGQNEKSRKKVIRKKQPTEKPEIDLHAESLPVNCQNLAPNEILNYQLKYLKQYVDKAKRKQFSNFVIIHGIGKGVLRSEIYQYLKEENIEFYDASFKKYGRGATEVRLRHH